MNFKQLPDEFYPTPPELVAKMVKQVVDEYEGQQEYEKVYNNRENYILDVGQRMLLTDGG